MLCPVLRGPSAAHGPLVPEQTLPHVLTVGVALPTGHGLTAQGLPQTKGSRNLTAARAAHQHQPQVKPSSARGPLGTQPSLEGRGVGLQDGLAFTRGTELIREDTVCSPPRGRSASQPGDAAISTQHASTSRVPQLRRPSTPGAEAAWAGTPG